LHEDLNANAGKQPPAAASAPAVAPGSDPDSDRPSSAPPRDVVRKRTYSAIGPSMEDEVAASLSTSELASYFWDMHKSRNSSVITRLVQGQLRSEVQCPECSHTSRTFDPFSCISVPLPKDQAERKISLVVFRRLPWLFKSTNELCRMIALGEMTVDAVVDSYVAMHRCASVAVAVTVTCFLF